MQNFRATNGYFVSFVCRYQDRSYYRMELPINHEYAELAIHDSGHATINCGDCQPTAMHLTAYDEYKAEENRQYMAWRENNAHLFA